MQYRGIAGGVDVNTETIANGINYGVGFGGGDLRRALGEGYSASSILDYLKGYKNPVAGSVQTQLQIMAQAERQQQDAQRAIQQQQQQFQQQLAAQQQQAQEAQRQLMIQMNRPERAPAEVRMAGGNQQQQQLRKRGTTGYFGRQGLRIGSLNVPTPGMQMSAGAAMQPASGTFS
jgi:hypothetical protein